MSDYGVTSGTTVNSGGEEAVELDGVAIGTTVEAGGVQYVYEGALSGTVVKSGGLIVDYESPISGLHLASGAALLLGDAEAGVVTLNAQHQLVVQQYGSNTVIGLAGSTNGMATSTRPSPVMKKCFPPRFPIASSTSAWTTT